jgi:four helix bundle protein
MAQSFRDLRIWQEAHKLLLEIYYITKKLPKEELYILTSQLKRSTLSIMANIAESQGRYGYQDKIQLLIIARGSIEETRSHLSAAYGLNYINKNTFNHLDEQYQNLARGVNSFISSIRHKKQNQK